MAEVLECVYPAGGDEPTCPACGNENAMLYCGVVSGLPFGTDFRECRDCGAVAIRVDENGSPVNLYKNFN